LRYFPVKNYLILYRQLADGVEIMRVVHGSRDLGALFGTGDAE
jgi:toxin ParE1/3/4